MSSLTSAPLAPLLDRLFAEADAPLSDAFLAVLREAGSGDRPTNRDGEDYLVFYSAAKADYLAVSRDLGRLLYMLVRSMDARAIVEYGTSFGISTLHLAAGLRDNAQGGTVITTEFEPSKIARARENFRVAGLDDLIEVREGDALESLAGDLPDAIDLVLLDGAKGLYTRLLEQLEPHLRPGAMIVADNVDSTPEYLAQVRAADGGYLSVAFAADIELSLHTG